MERLLTAGDVLFEGNPFVARVLLDGARAAGAETLSVFLSPLSRDEIAGLRSQGVALDDFVAEVMRRKLRTRTTKMKGALSPADLAEIERRATSAFAEMRTAWRFDHVMANHDGEGSDNWDVLGRPLGDARRTLLAFVDLLEGRVPPAAEKWREGNPL
jgi:guanylate kinase